MWFLLKNGELFIFFRIDIYVYFIIIVLFDLWRLDDFLLEVLSI